MSVTNTKAKSVYNANGTTTEWNLGFTYDDTVSNVHIYIVDANDNETEVTSNYSIADGVLTYPTTASGLDPLAEGNKLIIVRDTPRTQDIELTSNGKLDGKVLEGGYDKLTLQVQELTEQVNRAVKIPVTEESADNFLDPITAITEAKKEALVEIAQATEPAEAAKDTAVAKAQVATEQATIATNAATSAKAAQVGAKIAEQNATAQAEKAENAVTAFVEGLGTARNAVIDLGTFDGKTGVTSSRIIEFDKKPIAVSLRFSDTNKKLWLNGTNSTVGIEVVDNTHCNIFYSIASADFVGQNAVKGPFVVQAIIQYALLDVAATETELGAVQLATKAEAEAGTNDTKAMTPLKTKYAIEANAKVKTLRNDVDDLGDQVAAIEGKIPAEATSANQLADKEFVTTITDELAADITALNADIQQINLIKWVQALPTTGETKYLYAVPRNEVDKDGKKIVALYLWDGTEWRGAGGTSIDPGISEGDGIKGDYCTTYGIIDAPNGILTNPSGMEVVLKQGVVLQLAGQDIKTTISGDMAHTITSTADCDLFYVSGTTSLMEVAEIVWSRIEPDNGQTGVLAWWNPNNKKWKFKSNDTGNVWAEAIATPIAHIHTNGTTVTRIDHIGYRILDDEVYALKSDLSLSRRPLGEVYFSQSSLATDNPGALPGWTGEYYENGKTLFPDLYSFVKAQSTRYVTKTEYDNILATYGECPKYVVDEVDGSLRLPKYANYIKMANSTEGITQKGAGLPTVKAIANTAAGVSVPFSKLPNYAKAVQNSVGYTLMTGGSISTDASLSYVENDASLNSSIYGASNTVQPAHTTLYPWISAYTAAIPASVAQAAEFQQALTNTSVNKMDKVQFWTPDNFVQLRNYSMELDWANTYTGSASSTEPFSATLDNTNKALTMPADGVLLGTHYGGIVSVNGNQIFPSTTDANITNSCFPLEVRKGDVVFMRARVGTALVPFKYQSGANNIVLGLNYYGKYATLEALNTASASILNNGQGQGRWALVGDDTNGYTRYYTKPTNNTFSAFEWAAGGADTYLGQEADYVVDRKLPTENDPSWYRVWKSGWLEQGGIISPSSAWSTINLLKPYANTQYIILAAVINGNTAAGVTIKNKTISSFAIYQNVEQNWEAKGQGKMQTSNENPPLTEDLYLVGQFNSWQKQDAYKFVWNAQQNLYTITNVTVPNGWMKISSTNDVYNYGPVTDGMVMGSGDTISVQETTGNWNFNTTTQNLNVKFSLANMTVYIGAS